MQKVIIIGCPGAGKSTFARKLHNKCGLPLYYLDMIWHKADKTTIEQSEFDKKLKRLTEQSHWIIDGNYMRTLEMRLKACDTVFLLDFPLDVCISGVEARIGIKRDDMPWVESAFDDEFRQWITDFPNEQLPQIYRLLEKYANDKKIIVFKSRKDADNYLKITEQILTMSN